MKKLSLVLIRNCYTTTNHLLVRNILKPHHVEQFTLSKVYSLKNVRHGLGTNFVIFFQVFGLGNKTYEHYNKVAIYVDKRLEELGASRVFELGLGDDDAK